MKVENPNIPIETIKFKSVPGFEKKYAVDINTGEVYTFRKLKPYENKHGYLRVKLCRDKKIFQHFVHKIVLAAIKGHWVNGLEIDHNDKNKHNNKPDNLEHVTQAENLHRKYNGYNENQTNIQGEPF